MISKSKIKLIRSLKLKKFRIKNDLAIVEGSKIIKELVFQMPAIIESIWAIEGIVEPWLNEWSTKNEVGYITEDEMKLISSMDSLPNILAIVKIPHLINVDQSQKLIIYMDDVQDPGNVGTIIRTAEWFGHKSIICSPRCADRFSTKVIQASMGSVFRLNIKVMEWVDLKDYFTQHQLIYADMAGEDVRNWVNENRNAIVVIGNEGQGVTDGIKRIADRTIAIKASENSKTESLNASIAAGIIMYAWGGL